MTIATVTLNAAIDKTYYLDRFELGRVNRARDMNAIPGGKGLNVARVVHTFGRPVVATGIVSGNNGRFILDELRKAGIEHDFLELDAGESRLCLNMIAADGVSTELLEAGPTMDETHARQALALVERMAARARVVCLSGSLPRGLPASLYADMIGAIRAQGALPFLDTSGPALREGIAAAPYALKPNEDEIRLLLPQSNADDGSAGGNAAAAAVARASGAEDFVGEAAVVDRIRRLMDQGVVFPVVTLGAQGAVAGFGGRIYRVTAPVVQAVNPVGCGDAFVAGLAIAVAEDEPPERCLRFATAVAAANALTPWAGFVEPDDVERLLPLVRVEAS